MDKFEKMLERGVENVYPSREALQKVLESGKKLKIYTGYDPTGPTLHLGHAITLRKLAEFQKAGHEVIMLIGDFTGMIGDPTDKSATRLQLTREQVLANCKNYQKQAAKILSFEGENPAKLLFNSEWLGKLNFREVLELSACFTVQQMLERDMFQERLKAGKPVGLHEFLYPLMQGYDSVAMDVDLEIGGNDQTFNMLAGRNLMKAMKGKEKFVLTLKLLVDPTGKKMGKTEGNMITLEDVPNDVFGKVMSWPDELIVRGFEILTDYPLDKAKGMTAENPRDSKLKLAEEIVAGFFGAEVGERARNYFIRTVSKKEQPESAPEANIKNIIKIKKWSEKTRVKIVEIMTKMNLATSLSDARRKIEQGGVLMDGRRINSWSETIGVEDDGKYLRVGKFRHIKIKFEK